MIDLKRCLRKPGGQLAVFAKSFRPVPYELFKLPIHAWAAYPEWLAFRRVMRAFDLMASSRCPTWR